MCSTGNIISARPIFSIPSKIYFPVTSLRYSIQSMIKVNVLSIYFIITDSFDFLNLQSKATALSVIL